MSSLPGELLSEFFPVEADFETNPRLEISQSKFGSNRRLRHQERIDSETCPGRRKSLGLGFRVRLFEPIAIEPQCFLTK